MRPSLIAKSIFLFTLFSVRLLAAPPEITSNAPREIEVNQTYSYQLNATDPEGGALNYYFDFKPPSMAISNTGLITWTPTVADVGDHAYRIIVNDSENLEASQYVDVRVTDPSNTAPVISAEPIVQAPINQTYSFDIQASDIDGDPLTFFVDTEPLATGMTINSQGVINWTPATNQIGEYSVIVRAEDNRLGVAYLKYDLAVIDPTNNPPQITNKSPSEVALAGQLYRYELNAIDPDNDVLSYKLESIPNIPSMTISNTGVVEWTPGAADGVDYIIVVSVDDGRLGRDRHLYPLNIDGTPPSNSPPQAINSMVNATEDQSVAFTLQASDVDGDALTYSLQTQPTNGNLTGTAPNLTYSPNENFNGGDSLTFIVNDGTADSNVATVTLNVAAVNDPPLANIQSVQTEEGRALTITLTGSDIESGSLSYIIDTQPANGVLSGSENIFTYTPNSGFSGSDAFTFHVNDGELDSDIVNVFITVTSSNQAPTIVSQAPTVVAEASEYRYTVNVVDPDGDATTLTLLNGPEMMTVDSVAGALVWANPVVGVYPIVLQASDPSGLSVQQSFTLHVVSEQPPVTYLGSDFWFMFNSNSGTAETLVSIAAQEDTQIDIAMPLLGSTHSVAIAAGTVEIIDVAQAFSLDTTFYNVFGTQNLGFHLTSDRNVSVAINNKSPKTTDAALILPVDALGTEYMTMTWTDPLYNTGHFGGSFGNYIGFVATEDNTIVNVTPRADVENHAAGETYQVMLNAGQSYQVRTPVGARAQDYTELAGSLISADKPIAVFSGNVCAAIQALFCDHLVEQLIPIESWGASYETLPLFGRSGGDTFRVLAAYDNTYVVINDNYVAQLNAGEFYEWQTPQAQSVRTSKPASLAQFSNGLQSDGGVDGYGDPFMITVPSIEQALTSYLVTSGTTRFPRNYFNILAKRGSHLSITMNNFPVDPALWQDTANTDFVGAQIPVEMGQSFVFTGDDVFTLYSYGYGQEESYGYLGGSALQGRVSPANMNISTTLESPAMGDQVCVEVLVTDPANTPVAQTQVSFQYRVNGTDLDNSATTDILGQARWCFQASASVETVRVSTANLTETVSITAIPRQSSDNLAPLIVSRPSMFAIPNENYSYTLLARDADNDALSYTLLDAPEGMAIDANGLITWQTPRNFGQAWVEVEVSDGSATDTQRYRVSTHASQNRYPEITTEPLTEGFAGRQYSYRVIATDADRWPLTGEGDDLTFRIVSGPEGMAFVNQNNAANASSFLQWDVPADATGNYAISLEVRDQAGLTDTQSFTLVIEPNQVPQFTSTPVTTAITNHSYRYNYVANDANGDTLSYRLVSGPEGMTIVNSLSFYIRWTPTQEQVGDFPVIIEAADQFGGVTQQSFTISVAANQPPQFTSVPSTHAVVGHHYTYHYVIEDPEGDSCSCRPELRQGPAGMTLTNTLNWRPTAEQVGTHTVEIYQHDGHGAFVTQTFDVTVVPNSPPVFTSVPINYARVAANNYNYSMTASDADNDNVFFRLLSGPQNMIAFGRSLLWNPSATQLGTHAVSLEARDNFGGITIQNFDVTVVNEHIIITDSPVDSSIAAGELYQASVTAFHSDGRPVTYALAAGAPSGMTIDASSGAIQWQTNDTDVDSYSIGLIASDTRGRQASTSFNLEVNSASNSAPEIVSTPIFNAFYSEAYSYSVIATDADNDTLTYQLLSTIEGMTMSGNTINWLPTKQQAGAHEVRVQVSDGTFNTTQTFNLQVLDPDLFLTANILVDPKNIDLGETVLVQVQVNGNRGVTAIQLEVDGAVVALDPVNHSAAISGDSTGVHTLRATVTDAQETVVANTFFTVRDANDTEAPVVSITSPTDNSEVLAPMDIIGSVNDANLAEYIVAVAPANTQDFQILSRGSSNVTDGVLAQLDPSVMTNGQYIITLQASDINGETSVASVLITLDGDLKVGNFSFSVLDLEIPMAGIPIRVQRSYDSRRRHESLDFGYGWQVSYQDLKLDESSEPTEGWYWEERVLPFNSGSGPFVARGTCIYPRQPKKVTVTLPDGELHKFAVRPQIVGGGAASIADANCFLTPARFTTLHFDAIGNTDSTLEWEGLFNLYLTNTNDGNLSADPGEIAPYNINRYRLTTRNGYEYVINQDFGIEFVIDPNGHTITYSDTGIVHSAGKSIGFERDSQSRITAVVDPQGQRIQYDYNANGDLRSVTERDDATTRYAYNRNHGLLDIIDPLNRRVIRNIYDDSGRLVGQQDENGVEKSFNHDTAARLSTVVDLDGRSTLFGYDERGNVQTETVLISDGSYAADIVTSYSHDSRDNQTSRTIGLSTWTTPHDDNDDITESCNPERECVGYSNYNALGQEGTITDERDHSYTMHYDPAGNLTQVDSPTVTDPDTGTVSTPLAVNMINNQGLVDNTTDLRGLTTTYTYYPIDHVNEGQKHTESNPITGTVTYTYDANNNLATEMRERTVNGVVVNETTSYSYDERDRRTRTTYHDGSYTETEYDLAGNVDRERDRFGNWTDMVYDVYGRLTLTTYADGTQEVRTYSPEGLLETVTDRLGRVTRNEYDDAGRLRFVRNESDNTFTETRYTEHGWVSDEYDEKRNRTEYGYDLAGRRTQVIRHIDGGTQVHSFTYYPNGELHTETDALNRTTTYVLNELDQRIEVQYHNASRMAERFDFMGTRTRSIDQENRATVFDYDDLGRLTSVTPQVTIEGVAVPATSYTYDEAGNRLTQTDANGHTTIWTYDLFGRVLTRTLPEGMSESFVYNDGQGCQPNAGINCATASSPRTTVHTDFNGDTITTAYDIMGRMIASQYSKDGQSQVYTYYGNDQVHTVTDQHGTTIYTYDVRNRLTQVETPAMDGGSTGNAGAITTYGYDDVGNRTRVSITRNGQVTSLTTYTYDELNRLEHVIEGEGANAQTSTYTYDDVGNMHTLTYPSGLVTEYVYNTINQLTDVYTRDALGTVISHYNYGLTATGRRETITELDGRTTAYCYDALYRLVDDVIFDAPTSPITEGCLTDTTGADYRAHYDYDWVGNRTFETVDGVSTSYSYDDNDRLSQTGGTTYAYDDNGNTLSETLDGNVKTYTWDGKNKLTSLDNAGAITTYTYNHNGIRSSKTEAGTTTHFILDENRDYAQVLEEVVDNNAIVTYRYGHDLINQDRAGTVSYYHYDGLGSTRHLSDSLGSLTDSYDYEAFGETLSQTGSTVNNYLFTGEQLGASLSQYYLRARYYDQGNGRFTQMDTWAGVNR